MAYMEGELVLIVLLALPLVLGLVFRVATSHIFFSLMAGELLGRYFGHDIDTNAKALSDTKILAGYGEVILIVLPMLLTAFFMKGTLSRGRSLLHIIPLIITGFICATFVLPTLPDTVQKIVRDVPAGDWILELNRMIVGVMVALQLVSLWLFNRNEKKSKSKD